ncbi:hypothetical protein AYO41_01385 [Verrucomicrobia bacterium SCGC AG-212-E04]|nr:hypothetical protein AYO41_01385 [Verrucomicrobia bacterium SCGC AG-212-E04]
MGTKPLSNGKSAREFWCFISYRHSDNKTPGRQWATWLHQAIETYEVPADLVGTVNDRGDTIPERIFPVFRDEEELSVDADLGSSIIRALEASKFLISICSPRAVESTYVANEIRYFKKLGREDRILAMMIDGEPNASEGVGRQGGGFTSAVECFPDPMRRRVDQDGQLMEERCEPIAADFRIGSNEGWTSPEAYRQALRDEANLSRKQIESEVESYRRRSELMKLKIIAGVLGVPLGRLTARDQAYQLAKARKRVRVLAYVGAGFAGLAIVALVASWLAVRGEMRVRIALKESERRLERSQLEEGRAWVERARAALSTGDGVGAAMLAGRAVGFEGFGRRAQEPAEFEEIFPKLLSKPMESDPAVDRERRLVAADASRLIENLPLSILPCWSSPVGIQHQEGVKALAISRDGTRLASGSDDNMIKLWDAASGALVRTIRADGAVKCVAFSADGTQVASGSEHNAIKVWDAASGALVRTLEGHTDTVFSISFSPDGTRLASGSRDNTIRVWDAANGVLLRTLKGHSDAVYGTAFSPDGTQVASGSKDNTIRIWDATSGTLLRALKGHTDAVHGIAFSPDGTRLASGSNDNTIRIWETAGGALLRTLQGHKGWITSVAFSPDGTRLASGSNDGELEIWDTAGWTQLRTLNGKESVSDGVVWAVVFSADGKRLFSGSDDKAVKVWDVAKGGIVRTIQGHEGGVNGVAFSPDGTRLASAARDNTIKLWDASSGALVNTLIAHKLSVTGVAFSPDGTRVASCSQDMTIKLWDAASGALVRTFAGDSGVNSVSFSPDGTQLAGGFNNHKIQVWNAASGALVRSLEGHTDVVNSLAFSPDGTWLASGSRDKTIKIWNAASGALARTLQGHKQSVRSVAFSPDGTVLASGSDDNTIEVWDAASGAPVRTLRAESAIRCVTFSADSTRLADGSETGAIRVWDAVSGKLLRIIEGHTGTVFSIAFSPDGTRLTTGSRDSTIRVWDTAAGALLCNFKGHKDAVNSIAFTPDGTRLASGSRDHTIRVWDTASGAPLRKLNGHTDTVFSIAFSPDGMRLASGSSDNTIKLWDATSGVLLRTIEQGKGSLARTVAFSPDGKQLVSGSDHNTIKVWDAASGARLRTLQGHTQAVFSVSFRPDGTLLASGSDDDTIKIWNAASGELVRTLEGHLDAVNSVAFSPDGKLLASGSDDNTVKVWDAASGVVLRTLQGHAKSVFSVAFSPDGTQLASGSEDKTIKVWDASSGALLRTLEGHTGLVRSVAFSPNGKQLASGSDDNVIKVWHASTQSDLVARLRAGLLEFQGRMVRVVSLTSDSLFNDRAFGMLGGRMQPEITTQRDQHEEIMSVFASIRNHFAARALWNELSANGKGSVAPAAAIRRNYLTQLILGAVDRLEKSSRSILSVGSFFEAIEAAMTREALADPNVSLSLVSLVMLILDSDDPSVESASRELFTKLASTAPLALLEAMSKESLHLHRKKDISAAAKKRIDQFVGQLARANPTSSVLLRSFAGSLYASHRWPETLEVYKELMVRPDAVENDFATAAMVAGRTGSLEQARPIFQTGLERFPNSPLMHRRFALPLVNADKPAEALAELDRAAQFLPAGEEWGEDMMSSAAIANWLGGNAQKATELTEKLILRYPAYATTEAPITDWSEKEISAFRAVLAETFRHHPNLKSSEKKPENSILGRPVEP